MFKNLLILIHLLGFMVGQQAAFAVTDPTRPPRRGRPGRRRCPPCPSAGRGSRAGAAARSRG